jgi:hypothetical protein
MILLYGVQRAASLPQLLFSGAGSCNAGPYFLSGGPKAAGFLYKKLQANNRNTTSHLICLINIL